VCFANRGVALSRSKGTSRDEARWFNLDTRTGGQPESEGGGGGGGVSEETGQRQVMLQLCFRSVPSPMASTPCASGPCCRLCSVLNPEASTAK